MNNENEVMKEIFNRLDLLAAKLGVAVSHLWSVLILQAKIDGWRDLGLGVIFFILSLGAGWAAYLEVKKAKDYGASGFFFVVFLCFFTAACPFIYFSLGAILNPEYYALLKLKGLFQ